MKQKLYSWVEEYLFFPNYFQQFLSYLLLPLTYIYMLIIAFKRAMAKPIDFGIPVISIGNIIVGGSGKTPLAIELAARYENACVILRGYGRESKGLYIVSNRGEVQVDVKISGDEAMVLAHALPKATVIVSEDRKKAILKAKELACKVIFLDDGFSKYDINKFDILIRPKQEPTNLFCLPSGGYREPKMAYSFANLELKEGEDFFRVVRFSKDEEFIDTLPSKTFLLTAISKPKRLLEFLPKGIELEAFEDHHNFTNDEIRNLLHKYEGYNILTTQKDYVKLKQFNLNNLYLMNLSLEIKDDTKLEQIDKYIKTYNEL